MNTTKSLNSDPTSACCCNRSPFTSIHLKASGTSQQVADMAVAMEDKLALNRHKGDAAGWRAMDPWALVALLKKEVAELEQEMVHGSHWKGVQMEAADVANFAMMIADNIRQRQLTAEQGGATT